MVAENPGKAAPADWKPGDELNGTGKEFIGKYESKSSRLPAGAFFLRFNIGHFSFLLLLDYLWAFYVHAPDGDTAPVTEIQKK